MTLLSYLLENEREIKARLKRKTGRRNSEEHHDIFQGLLLAALKHVPRADGNIPGYVSVAINNKSINIHNHYNRFVDGDATTKLEHSEEHATNMEFHRAEVEEIAKQADLSKREMDIFRACLKGLTYGEIAGEEGRAYDTVKTTYYNMLAKLRLVA